MTKAARKVLNDCRGALKDFKDGIQGESWRRHWILCVVLLRAVGNVLEKIDSKQNKTLKDIIKEEYKNIKLNEQDHEIYWEFICKERNNILKEYKVNAGQGVTIHTNPLHFNLKTGEIKNEDSPSVTYHYTITSGPLEGRDQRKVVEEAIIWWENYLDKIDDRFKKEGQLE